MLMIPCAFGFLPCASVRADPRDLAEHVGIVLEAARLSSVEKLAAAMDIAPGLLRQQLQGEGHLSLTRIIAKLGKDDPVFFARYGWLLVCRFGLPPEAETSARLWMSFLPHRKSVAKMAAERLPERERA